MNTTIYNEYIIYDPYNGTLKWIHSGKTAGSVVNVNGRKYITVSVKGNVIRGHKLAWILVTGEEPKPDARIRFIDGDSLNLKASNLTYGTGKLSSYLKKTEYRIRRHSSGSFDVISHKGDIVKWKGRRETEEAAKLFVKELSKPPFSAQLNFRDNKLFGDVDGALFSLPAKSKEDAIAIAQALLLTL